MLSGSVDPWRLVPGVRLDGIRAFKVCTIVLHQGHQGIQSILIILRATPSDARERMPDGLTIGLPWFALK